MDTRKLTGKAAILAAAICAAAAMPSWAATNITANVTLTEDADWRDRGTVTIASGVTINLAGHKLTAHFAGQPAAAATITSSVAGGELHAIVDDSFNNNNIALTGSLKFVKEGAGTWTATKTGQNYTGGTLVSEGQLRMKQSTAMSNYMIPRTPAVEIGPDGTFEANGTVSWGYHSTILNGGTFCNSVNSANTGSKSINGTMSLSDDSYLRIAANTVEWNALSFDGHTLFASISEGATWSRGNTLTGPGTIDVSGDGVFLTSGAMNAPTVNLRVACALNMANEFSVKDYYANYSGSANAGTAALKVNGVFTPVTSNFYGCTMMNGSTIDLSAKTGVWSATSTFTTGDNTVGFASGATVTIDIHGRTPVRGEQIVAWDEAPLNVTFQWDAATATNEVALISSETGIYYGIPDNTVVTAAWTGEIDDDVSKSGNWICRNRDGLIVENAIPGEFAAVDILGTVNVNIPTGTVFTCASINLNCSLSANCDWRGLNALSGTVDLKGKNLLLSSLLGSGTITDSVGGGELHVDIAANTTVDNTAVALTGKLKFVKEGEGTFVATKTGQSYTGHTQVSNGTFKVNNQAASTYVIPQNSLTVLEPNGTLDINGSASWGHHSVSNNGGRIYNDYANHTGARSMNLAHHDLGADSTIHVEADTVAWSVLSLNGHTLNLEIFANKTLYVGNTVNGPGMIDIKYGGWLHTRQAINMPDVDFKVGGALYLESALTVHDYTPAYSYASNNGSAPLNVTGTFTPPATHNNFYGCTMQDGSTIDLSGINRTLTAKSNFTAGKNTIGFTEGAKVYLDLGERKVSSRTPVISWTAATKPANVDSVKFNLVGVNQSKSARTKNDGVYVSSGFMVLVR